MRAADLVEIGDVCALHTEVRPSSYALREPEPGVVQPEYSRVFLPAPEAVGAVRRFAGETLALWRLGAMVPDLALAASELGTNAVLHASTPFRVTLALHAGVVRLAIEDVAADHAQQQRAVARPGGQRPRHADHRGALAPLGIGLAADRQGRCEPVSVVVGSPA